MMSSCESGRRIDGVGADELLNVSILWPGIASSGTCTEQFNSISLLMASVVDAINFVCLIEGCSGH
jgi:hypothetical protein